MTSNNSHYDSLISDALMAAFLSSKVILQIYKNVNDKDFGLTLKKDQSPLTIADLKSHEIIIQTLSKSGLFVLSEESENTDYKERENLDLFWLIDPLDGTKEFIAHNGEFTVNIALIHQKRPVLGVVFAPVKDKIYFALEKKGSYFLKNASKYFQNKNTFENILKNSQKIVSTEAKKEHLIKIVCSRSHKSTEISLWIESLKKEFPQIKTVISGSSLKFCLVASGKVHFYPRFGTTMEWDTAASQIILTEAGANIFDMGTKKPLLYNKENLRNPYFIAANTKSLSQLPIF